MDGNWKVLIEMVDDLEASILCGFLEDRGIPSRIEDGSPYSGAMRIIGGLAQEVVVLVPEALLEEARSQLSDLARPD